MHELEHKISVYYDEDLSSCTIRAEKLLDNAMLVLARTVELYDGAEKIRVHTRFSRKGRLHFYSGSVGRRGVFAFETDDLHDEQVSDLFKLLDLLSNFSVTLRFKKDNLYCDEIIQRFPKNDKVLKMF